MEWTIISAVNDDAVLKSCLLDSPGIKSASEVILQRGFSSAPRAYNEAIAKAKTDLLVFVHQDMYFPDGWIESVQRAIETLETKDPNWGVLGVWGTLDDVKRAGYLCWTGNAGMERPPFEGGQEVMSLDEVVLIFRKSSGLKFDEALPGYHMYGTDICLESQRQGRRTYAISAFCIHNTNIGGFLPGQFWKCYLFMRRKWKHALPFETPCITVTDSYWPILHWNLVYIRDRMLGRRKPVQRVASPRAWYQELIANRRIKPLPTTPQTTDNGLAVAK